MTSLTRPPLVALMRRLESAYVAEFDRRLADSDVNIDAMYVLSTSAEGIEVAIAVEGDVSADLPVTGSISR